MLIREAVEADLPEILEVLADMDGEDGLEPGEALPIWRRINGYPYYKIFVAECDRMIIGTCSLIIIDNLGHKGAKLAVAESMIIRPEFRGRGIGSQMMQYVMERARDENCYKLMLSSDKKRVLAHRFYEQSGFQQHGISYMIEFGKDD